MEYQVSMTPEQALSLGEWAMPDMAPVLVDQRRDGALYVAQGDSRCLIAKNGTVTEDDLGRIEV